MTLTNKEKDKLKKLLKKKLLEMGILDQPTLTENIDKQGKKYTQLVNYHKNTIEAILKLDKQKIEEFIKTGKLEG